MKVFSDKKLEALKIVKKDSFNKDNIDIKKSSKYKNKDIIISFDNELVIKDPFNKELPEAKTDLKTDKVVLIPEQKFDLLKSDILTIYAKSIELDRSDEDEISYKLDETDISKALTGIFFNAMRRGISDIHILPKEKCTVIKFREDGELLVVDELPKHHSEFLINKIKTESRMDISNKMTPQDGKLKVEIDNRLLELRVSTLPTVHGENAVMRIQQTENLEGKDLTFTGFELDDLEVYRKNFLESYGLILNVGGTGAGKTTTFYLTIQELIKKYPNKNIMTAEDPVEMKNDIITQIEINEKEGRTYPVVLKSLLRQDPDIILIGEIRDAETASIGVRASLTGHLVLATLHANDSFNAITRLRDIGIEDQLISSTASCLLSQKLVKKLCPHCKKKVEIEPELKSALDLDFDYSYEAVGCEKCNDKGFVGREAVIEVLDIDEELKGAISSGRSEVDIKKIMKSKGFRNLWDKGLNKVKKGLTTLTEVQKELKRDAILNFEDTVEAKVDTRIIFYPYTEIEAIVKEHKCKVFDISSRGVSFLFDEPVFLSIEKECSVSIEGNKIKFIPKGYGKNGDKFLVSGIYFGNLKKYLEE